MTVGNEPSVLAQYPTLTSSDRARQERIETAARARADSAFKAALPIIEKEEREGKPYVPWAHRPTDLPQASIPAFPGAEGGGMYTFGGRGGRALTVSTLADDGLGSFRWACEQGGARTVVFNVSGTIWLRSPVVIRAPYITIAGQTAPGEGVQIAGESVWIDTHDVVIRHMRFRRGGTDVARRDDALGGNPIGNICLDHLSCSYGLDENVSFYRHMYEGKKLPTVNVTMQDCLSAKALDLFNHAFGSTLGGENCTFVRCLWACNTGRNPSIGWNGVFTMVNCVLYNWMHRTVDGGDRTALYNIINNYYKPGPATPVDEPVRHRVVKPESGGAQPRRYGRVYCTGNVVEGDAVVSGDNWRGGVQVELEDGVGAREALMRVGSPFPMAGVTVLPAAEAYRRVLKEVGATLPRRDAMDERILDEVRSGRAWCAPDARPDTVGFARRLPADSYKLGIVTLPEQYGGWPLYGAWKPWEDSDADGIPDEWERRHGLNPNDGSDANRYTGSGYTNLEIYINGIGIRD